MAAWAALSGNRHTEGAVRRERSVVVPRVEVETDESESPAAVVRRGVAQSAAEGGGESGSQASP